MSVQTTLHSVHRLHSPPRYWTCLVTWSSIWSSLFEVRGTSNQVLVESRPLSPSHPTIQPPFLPKAAEKRAIMMAVVQVTFDSGVLDFMSRLSNFSTIVPSPIAMTPTCAWRCWRGASDRKKQQFKVACKRQYILETLHGHVMVSPPKDNVIGVNWWIFFFQQA